MTDAVVPANAGTHTARSFLGYTVEDVLVTHERRWLWVPAFAGTTR